MIWTAIAYRRSLAKGCEGYAAHQEMSFANSEALFPKEELSRTLAEEFDKQAAYYVLESALHGNN